MAKHMTKEDRQEIEALLRRGRPIAGIAKALGRAESTIAREVRLRRVDSRKWMRETNALCVHYADCRRRDVCATGCGMRKLCRNCPGCHDLCPDFAARTCPRLLAPPFVCNGCADERACPLGKKYYIVDGAQAAYDGTLRESRRGVRATDTRLALMGDALRAGLANGQSIHAIMANNPTAFTVKERTVYDYTGAGAFEEVDRGDLPFACSRRPRRRKAVTKTNAKCRIGRTYKEFIAFMIANPSAHVAEMDQLEGSAGGKVAFTFIFPAEGLMIGFLRDHKDSASCTEVFRLLWEAAGPALFRRIFAVVLTDNGTEFSDPEAIERDPLFVPSAAEADKPWKDVADPAKRRTRLFYCDAYSPTQKPHVERGHHEERRLLVKGTSFDALGQADLALAFSHVASYPKEALGDATPYDLFVRRFGEPGRRFLDRIDIIRIPGNDVVLEPRLLGPAFELLAARAVLRQNGIG